MTINRACKLLRLSHEITQEKFANMSGLGRGAIAMFETGRSNSLDIAEIYLQFFGDINLTKNIKLSEYISIQRAEV